MAFLPENQSDRLRCYRNAINNWNARGYILFSRRVEEWIRNDLALSADDVRRSMHDHVIAGGAIDEQIEKRPEYVSYQFHYDLRITIGGRRVYFETVLICHDPSDADDPVIQVVNAHDA